MTIQHWCRDDGVDSIHGGGGEGASGAFRRFCASVVPEPGMCGPVGCAVRDPAACCAGACGNALLRRWLGVLRCLQVYRVDACSRGGKGSLVDTRAPDAWQRQPLRRVPSAFLDSR